jgi:hypothetical protein
VWLLGFFFFCNLFKSPILHVLTLSSCSNTDRQGNATELFSVNNLLTFHETRRFITLFTRAHHRTIYCQMNPVQTVTSCFLKPILMLSTIYT